MKSNTTSHEQRKSFRKWALTGQHVGYSRLLAKRTWASVKKANRKNT